MWNWFFDKLKIVLAPFLHALTPLLWFHAIFVKLFTLLGAIMGLMLTIAGMLWAFVEFAGGLDSVTQSINNVSAYLVATPAAPILSQVNRVVPLNEFLVLEAVLLGVFVACTLLRWIKSFMPTVN